jgi:hypothetical protein
MAARIVPLVLGKDAPNLSAAVIARLKSEWDGNIGDSGSFAYANTASLTERL